MDASSMSREEFISSFAHYSKYRGNFNRAIEAVLQNSVKKHIFKPSGRVVYSVVGKSGDEFLDPEKPYCSCNNFFFRVLGGRETYCYHLLSYRIALESKRVDEIVFADEEYVPFMRLMMHDILDNLRDKGDKDS